MNKSIQNPKKVLGIIAGVLFLAALLLMLLPGMNIKLQEGTDSNMTFFASLFALAFGGDLTVKGIVDDQPINMSFAGRVNVQALIAVILMILVILGVIAIIYGLISEKISKKVLIITCAVIIVLTIVSAVLVFAAKESMLRTGIASFIKMETKTEPTAEQIDLYVQQFKEMAAKGYASYGLGTGAIISPIFGLLGAATLGGVVALSRKDA